MSRVSVNAMVDLGDIDDDDLREEVLARGKSIIVPGGDISLSGTLADFARRLEVMVGAKVIRTTAGTDFAVQAGRDNHTGHGCATIIILEGV